LGMEGILALGANCFNIAFLMPVAGYAVYRLIKGKADPLSFRGMTAAALAAYVGLNVAALATAVMFGSQYHLFQAPDGTPLYFMYPLKVTLAVMMSEHLVLAGPVEAIITVLGIWFVGRNYPELLERSRLTPFLPSREVNSSCLRNIVICGWPWVVLIVLSPLGLLATGTAFGEWGMDELSEKIGFIPAGLQQFAEVWAYALFPDYSVPGLRRYLFPLCGRIYILCCAGGRIGSRHNDFTGKTRQGVNYD
jgi:cobalt/nickel transport system permease protein